MSQKVYNIRRLNIDDVNKYWSHTVSAAPNNYQNNDAFDILDNYIDNPQGLIDQDFIFANVNIDGKKYNFISGFPGDEHCAVLFNDDLSEVISLHGSLDPDPNNKLISWFLDSLKESNDVPKEWFI